MHNNEFDNIEIPNDIDLYIKKGLSKAIKEKKAKRNKFIKVATYVSILGFLFLNFNMESLADKIPFIKDVYKEIRSSEKSEVISINFNDYFEEELQEVNQTVSSYGKTITVESVLCDGKNIAISYIIKSDEKFEIDDTMSQLISNSYIKINNTSEYSFSSIGIEGVYTDDYTFVGTELLRLENKDSLPDKFNINVTFDNIDGNKNLWEFGFLVKSNTSKNKIIKVNKTKSKFTLSTIEVRPLSLIIEDIIPKNSKDTMYDVEVYDDKNNTISWYVKRDEEHDTNLKITTTYKALDKDCKYIKIVYKEMELIPNSNAPGYTAKKKSDVNDVVFKIDLG